MHVMQCSPREAFASIFHKAAHSIAAVRGQRQLRAKNDTGAVDIDALAFVATAHRSFASTPSPPKLGLF